MLIISRVLVSALGLLLAAYIIPGIDIKSVGIAIIAAIILGLLNLFARPILIVLTLPITFLTLGLFIFVINATLFWFVSTFINGFDVQGFWAAVGGSLLVSIVSAVGNRWIRAEAANSQQTQF